MNAPDGADDFLDLDIGPARARIALRGAQPLVWRVGGRDLLWTPDPDVWAETAPLLFPVVGWTRDGIRHRGRAYPLGLHGFARGAAFTVADRSADSVRLTLRDSPATRSLYPFAFRLDVVYRLTPEALAATLEIENAGREPMPYAVGLHPGFCWPLGGSTSGHTLVFEKDERPDVPVIAPGGLFAADTRRVPLSGRLLPLDSDLFAREALCFLHLASRRVAFDNGEGTRLVVELENFPHLALWARPPAPFLCIEAWTGHGDPVGFDGEIADKPSMIALAPGARARHAARFVLEGAFPPLGAGRAV